MELIGIFVLLALFLLFSVFLHHRYLIKKRWIKTSNYPVYTEAEIEHQYDALIEAQNKAEALHKSYLELLKEENPKMVKIKTSKELRNISKKSCYAQATRHWEEKRYNHMIEANIAVKNSKSTIRKEEEKGWEYEVSGLWNKINKLSNKYYNDWLRKLSLNKRSS